MRRRFLLIHNTLAGMRGNRLASSVISELLARGAQVTQVREASVEAALRAISTLLDESHFDAVVVAGGDGTVRAVSGLLAGRNIAMGLVPAGTGNVLALEIGIPFDPAGITDTLIFGPSVEVAGSSINGQPFFLMAGVGFDGEVIARLDVATKQKFGKLGYLWPLVCALLSRPPALEVTIDGVGHRASWVIGTRARHYAGGFDLAREASKSAAREAGMAQPGMIAVLFEAKSRRQRLVELLALASGRLDKTRGVKWIACERITVSSSRPVSAQADGDPTGTTPVDISTGQAPLRLIVPSGYAGVGEVERISDKN